MNERVFAVLVCASCGEQVRGHDPCAACGTLETKIVRFRVSPLQLLKQIKPRDALVEQTVYFGCWRQAGHYYWHRGMRKASGYGTRYEGLTPWGHHVDGGLFGRNESPGQGIASVFHKDGWTALAFEDRSVDSRPGSYSVFCIPEVLGYHDAVEVARAAFPEVWDRYEFEVTPA